MGIYELDRDIWRRLVHSDETVYKLNDIESQRKREFFIEKRYCECFQNWCGETYIDYDEGEDVSGKR